MAVKFYTDTHIAKAVAVQCQQRGVDIIRCQDVDLENASDDVHLAYAVEHRRVMVTSDRGFINRHHRYLAEGKFHAGIMYVPPEHKDNIGLIVRHIIELHELIEGGAADLENDIFNQLIRIKP